MSQSARRNTDQLSSASRPKKEVAPENKPNSLSTRQTDLRLKTLNSLIEMLNNEKHDIVRAVILNSILIRLSEMKEGEWESVKDELNAALNRMTATDEDNFSDSLFRQYLRQRAEQKPQKTSDTSGQFTFTDSQKVVTKFSMWTRGKRPLTRVERLIYSFLEQDKARNLQKFALKVSHRFSREVDRWEDSSRLQGAQSGDQKTSRTSIPFEKMQNIVSKIGSRLQDIIQWVVLQVMKLTSRGMGKTLQNLLPEVLTLNATNSELTMFTLDKWEAVNREKTQKIGRSLKNAMKNARRIQRTVFIIAGIIIFIVALPLIGSLIQYLILAIGGLLILSFVLNSMSR
jgi:hypothetical protein